MHLGGKARIASGRAILAYRMEGQVLGADILPNS